MPIPLVLVHGYASSGNAYAKWHDAFVSAGRKVTDIFVGNYITLTNEVTVDDIANGFNHALHEKGLDGAPFDAIVHSTGMLVVRSWLTASNPAVSRRGLLKHLVALAPATFGSPIAAKGAQLVRKDFHRQQRSFLMRRKEESRASVSSRVSSPRPEPGWSVTRDSEAIRLSRPLQI